jgi:hypothetical protein
MNSSLYAATILLALSCAASAQNVKEALLAEGGGLNADWTCDSAGGGRAETGRSELTFKEEGSKVVVDVNNGSRGSCKSDVDVADSGATFKGCRGTPVQMTPDANDKSVPFIGKGGACTYKFKRK